MAGDVINIASVNRQWAGYISVDREQSRFDEHRHAQFIYQRDVEAGVKQPWRHWSCCSGNKLRQDPQHKWGPFTSPPGWMGGIQYKYQPTVVASIQAGDAYWTPNILTSDLFHTGEWMDTPQQRMWLQRGLICLSESQAVILANKLLGAI